MGVDHITAVENVTLSISEMAEKVAILDFELSYLVFVIFEWYQVSLHLLHLALEGIYNSK